MSEYDPNYIQEKVYALIGQKAVVVDSSNRILVLQRSDKSGAGGKWSLPGGALEKNEEPFPAIKREILEETQLSISDIQPFYLRTYTTEENDFVLIVGYKCKASSEKVVLNWEHDDYRWLAKEDALKLELTDDGRFFVEQFVIL